MAAPPLTDSSRAEATACEASAVLPSGVVYSTKSVPLSGEPPVSVAVAPEA